MSDVKKMATRDAYGAALAELGEEKSDLVVFEADLAAATKTGVFRKKFPERHFECGIAEGNMMAVAAGAAAMGLTPFASSFGDDFGRYDSLADLFRQIGYDERLHKLESEANMAAPRFR